MEKLRFFEEPGIGAMCFLAGKDTEEYLEIDEHGVVAIPADTKPSGFYLVVAYSQAKRIAILQKDVATEKGKYHRHFLVPLGENVLVTTTHIPVLRVGKNVWTPWHKLQPNRLDCWLLEDDGHVDLFQVGVVTHNDGQTFHLLGEWRWRGQLFQETRQGIVGKPEDPKWGNFDVRRSILDNPDFRKLLKGVVLALWQGKPEELNPPLDPVPGPGLARMQWYIPFAGQTGQGPAILYDGTAAWVHGADILDSPDPDGIKRLHRNDLIEYHGIQHNWGKDSPPKLLCVERA